jgi:hypothetical protein
VSILDLHHGCQILELWADKAMDQFGELDPELDKLLQELEGKIEDKVEAYCRIIRELELTSKARSEESARIKELSDRDASAARQMKNRLQYFFSLQNVKKLETKSFRVSVCANGGHQPMEVTIQPEDLPQQFQKVTVTANTEAIREALAMGTNLDGCKLLPRGEHLRIK